LKRDLFSDEDERALTLLDIVEPLQYPLSVLQKDRRHALASPLLVASEEMRRVSIGQSTPGAFAEAIKVETADPACSACFGTTSFVCFDCSQLSIFESASHRSTLANMRFEFSCRQDNQQQPQGKGAAAEGPQTRACLSTARRF